MDPLFSSTTTTTTTTTTTSVTSAAGTGRDEVLRPFVEEGNRPSLEQIDRWFKEQAIVNIVVRKYLWGDRSVTLPPSRISEIGPYRSEKEADALILIEGYEFGVYVSEVTSFRVETIKKVGRSLLVPLLSKEDSQIKTVTLLSHGERFVVDQERLKKTIPFFRAMFESNMRESKSTEIDMSSFSSTAQLKQIIKYAEGSLCIDESNALDLFTISYYLGITDLRKDIQLFLILKLSQRTSIKALDVIDVFVLSESIGMTELHKVIKLFLLQNITRSDIEILKSKAVDPVLQNFLKNIRYEISRFYLDDSFGLIDVDIRFVLSSLINENRTLKDTTTVNIECKRKTDERVWSFLGGKGLKDIFRILEILGANIESLTILNITLPGFFEIVEYVKRNSQIKSLNVSCLEMFFSSCQGNEEETSLADCINYLSTRLKTFNISE